MFFMAEYANMITVSCLATILFFGGWLSPFPDRWTWQLYIPGVGLILGAIWLAYDTAMKQRGIARIQLAVVTALALVLGVACLIPAVCHRARPVLVSAESSRLPLLLCLDARHAAALSL